MADLSKTVLIWETLSALGGGQRITLLIAQALNRQNVKTCFLIPKEGRLSEKLKEFGYPYHLMEDCLLPLGKKNLSAALRYLKLSASMLLRSIKIIQKVKPNVIYVPGPAALPWGALAGFFTKVPVIWHFHHLFEDRMTLKLLNLLGLIKTVKRIFCISTCVANQIAVPAVKEKTTILYNPVDFTRFCSGQKGVLRIEYNIPKSTFLLATIGFLQESKRQHLTIETVKLLRKKGMDVRGILVGADRENAAEYKNSLYELTSCYGLDKEIIFTGEREDIPNILADVNAVIVSSVEGLSLVAIEAMAAGVPVIGINEGGVAEVIKMSHGGVTFNYGDGACGIAICVESIMQTAVYNRLSECAKIFSQKMGFQNYNDRIIEEFSSIIGA